jgi:hypothetical protein
MHRLDTISLPSECILNYALAGTLIAALIITATLTPTLTPTRTATKYSKQDTHKGMHNYIQKRKKVQIHSTCKDTSMYTYEYINLNPEEILQGGHFLSNLELDVHSPRPCAKCQLYTVYA